MEPHKISTQTADKKNEDQNCLRSNLTNFGVENAIPVPPALVYNLLLVHCYVINMYYYICSLYRFLVRIVILGSGKLQFHFGHYCPCPSMGPK